MARTTIQPDGRICFRTKNLPLSLASAFARCIQANSRFADVVIEQAKSKKEELYRVLFRPSNPERCNDLYASEWQKNQAKADAEGADYVYFRNTDNPSVIFVFNPISGQTWEMFNGQCQCPHSLYRLEKSALQCKHEIELQRRLTNGLSLDGSDKATPQPVRTASDRAERDARFQAMANLDW